MNEQELMRIIEDHAARLRNLEAQEVHRPLVYTYLLISDDVYTPSVTDENILCDPEFGPITVTLPDLSIEAGNPTNSWDIDSAAMRELTVVYTILNLRGAFGVTIDGFGGQTISGNLTYSLPNQWDSVTITSDLVNWMVIAQVP